MQSIRLISALLLLIAVSPLCAQKTLPWGAVNGSLVGDSYPPATCRPGQIYLQTSTVSIYACSEDGQWVLFSGEGLPAAPTLKLAASQEVVLSYEAPVGTPCKIEVSEDPEFATLARDVDADLFTGANYDLTRPSTFVNGKYREVKLGSRRTEQATTGKYFDRSLKSTGTYYARVTECANFPAVLSFRVPDSGLGDMYPDAQQVNSEAGAEGWELQPDWLNWDDRDETMIYRGAEIRKVTLPRDRGAAIVAWNATGCTGTNWTGVGSECSTADSSVTTYSGSTRDPLIISDAVTSSEHNLLATVTITGSISGSPTGDDKFVDVCMRDQSVLTPACMSRSFPIDLTLAGPQTVGSTDFSQLNLWAYPGGALHSPRQGAAQWLVIPRTTNPAYTISIDHVGGERRTVTMGAPQNTTTTYCGSTDFTYNGDKFRLCLFDSQFYAIDMTAGRARWLGPQRVAGQTYVNFWFGHVFSRTDGAKIYGISRTSTEGNYRLIEIYFTGDPTVEYSGSTGDTENPNFTFSYLTPAPCTLNKLNQAYDARFNEEWWDITTNTPGYPGIPNLYTSTIVAADGHERIPYYHRASQEAGAFIFVFDPTAMPPASGDCAGATGNIIAGTLTSTDGFWRFGTVHSTFTTFDNSFIRTGQSRNTKATTTFFGGPWHLKVTAIGGGDITPACSPLCDVQFVDTGGTSPLHATDPSPSGMTSDFEIKIRPGDMFVYCKGAAAATVDYGSSYCGTSVSGTFEVLEIVSINEADNTGVIRRGPDIANSLLWKDSGLSAPTTIAVTITADGTNNVIYGFGKSAKGSWDKSDNYWNYEQDPHGNIEVNSPWAAATNSGEYPPACDPAINPNGCAYSHLDNWKSPVRLIYNSPSHGGYANGLYMGNIGEGYEGFALNTIDDLNKSSEYQIAWWKKFANQSPGHIAGVESHTFGSAGTARERETRWDVMPRRQPVPGTAALVPGTSQVYKMSGVTLKRKIFPTSASAGVRLLRDLSSPATGDIVTDATPYAYCIAEATDECRSGSATGDVYLSAPLTRATNRDQQSTYPAYKIDVSTPVSAAIYDANPMAMNSVVRYYGWATDATGRGFHNPFRIWSFTDFQNMYWKAFPIGADENSWVLYKADRKERTDWYMTKLRPYPEPDGIDRTTFIPVPISATGPVGTSYVQADFGYEEFDDPATPEPELYRCRSRRDNCTVVSATINEANPFEWASLAGTSGVPCASGCSLQIPRDPGKVAYVQLRFYNALHVLLETRPIGTY